MEVLLFFQEIGSAFLIFSSQAKGWRKGSKKKKRAWQKMINWLGPLGRYKITVREKLLTGNITRGREVSIPKRRYWHYGSWNAMFLFLHFNSLFVQSSLDIFLLNSYMVLDTELGFENKKENKTGEGSCPCGSYI